jgi:hypothetical protein
MKVLNKRTRLRDTLAIALLGLWCSGAAALQDEPPLADSSAAQEGVIESDGSASAEAAPAYFQLRFGTVLGAGTFVLGPTWNPYFTTGMTVSSGFDLGPIGFYGSQQIWLEWTQSDETTAPYQGQMVDPSFEIRYGFLDVEDWGTNGGASLFTSLPVSLASRQSGTLATGGIGLDSSYVIPIIQLSPYVAGATMFNWIVPDLADRYPTTNSFAMDQENNPESGTLSCIRRSEREAQNFACQNIPSIMNSSLTAGLSQPFWGEKLSLNISASLLSYLSAFWGPDDAFTSPNATPGPGLQHYTTSSINLTFVPLPWLSFVFGTWSFQPLLTADGKSVRFPFWDFLSTRNNLSTVFFDVIITM